MNEDVIRFPEGTKVELEGGFVGTVDGYKGSVGE